MRVNSLVDPVIRKVQVIVKLGHGCWKDYLCVYFKFAKIEHVNVVLKICSKIYQI